MFDTQKNELMNNVIAYVAPKNKTMAHSMSLNNRISCVVGISIFGFKTYWEKVFDLMQIQTSSTFEQFLQAETLNAKKNKSYYQRYDVKWLRDSHKQAMIKQQIYDNMLASRSGVDLHISFKDCFVGLAITKAKNSALETAPYKSEAKKAAEDAAAE